MVLVGFIPLASVLTFGRPALLLALVAVAAPVLFSRRSARRGHRVSPLSVALQCAAIAMSVVALAGPVGLVGPGLQKPVLIFQDVSASCRVQRDRTIQLPPDVPVERLAFASSVAADAVGLDANRTDLAPALRLAAARAPDIAGVVIHTDGRFADRWSEAAQALAATDLPVAVVAMGSPPADARVAQFDAKRRPDGTAKLRVTVRSNALDRRTLTVRRVRPALPEPLFERSLDLMGDQPVTITVIDAAPLASAAEYQAQLTPADTFGENDSASAGTLPARRVVAVIGPLDQASEALAGLQGVDVRAVDATQAGAEVRWWMDFSGVVLADANGELLARPAREALEQYVRSGGGLVHIGAGPHGSPADSEDPLNRVAALVANPFQRKPLRAIVILDASGSMAESTGSAGIVKFDQAVEAVGSLRHHLTPDDSLAVITFSDDANQVYDSGAGRPDFGAIGEALSRVRPGGSTDVGKALDLVAGQAIQAGRDGLVLVVSDLSTKPFDPQAMAEAFRKRRISLAVVAISSAGDNSSAEATPLEALARLLKGSLVAGQEDLSGLAKVFADLLRRTRGDALRRGEFSAAVVRPFFGLTVGVLPKVQSYLLAGPQVGADVVAQVAGEHDPLLAVRQVGMGRTVTLAMPPEAGENPVWAQSGISDRILSRAVMWSLRPGQDSRFTGQVSRRDGKLHVVLDARDDNRPVNGLDPVVRIVPIGADSDGQAGSFSLDQTAPGRYEGSAGASGASLGVEIATSDGSAGTSPQSGSVVWQCFLPARAPLELAEVGSDAAELNRLAELTGGRLVPPDHLAQFGQRLTAARRRALWPILLAVAVGLMLIEWAVTRVRRRT